MNRRGMTSTVHGTVTLGQNDLALWGSGTARELTATLTLTVSAYDRDPDQVAAFAARRTMLSGVSSLVQGFPRSSQNLRLVYDGLPRVSPFVSLTHTRWALGQPDSNAVTLGAYLAVTKATELNASWERYRPGGGAPAQQVASMGADHRF